MVVPTVNSVVLVCAAMQLTVLRSLGRRARQTCCDVGISFMMSTNVPTGARPVCLRSGNHLHGEQYDDTKNAHSGRDSDLPQTSPDD